MMRLIQKHSDYAHIRIRICIRMYPNIFADADIKLHMYPIPKSAWEKIRMANSNELLCGNRCRLGREGGDGNTHKTTCSYHFYQIISLWDAALRWKENLSSFNCLRFSFGGTDWTGKAPTSNFSTDRVRIAHSNSQNHNPRLFSAISIILLFHCRFGYHKVFTSIYYDSVSPESVSAGWPSCK